MKILKLLVIMITTGLIISGCSLDEEKISTKDTEKSSINSNYINLTMVKPKTINPIINTDKSVGYILNLVYDGLFTIDENYNVVPQLVKEYGISKDGMTIDLELNDAKWHNNKPVTSYDVKYTVDLIKSNLDSPYNSLVSNISSINIKNDKQFTISFKEQYAFSIETLIFPIISEDSLGKLSKNNINQDKYNLIGNGAYKIEKYGNREGMILSVNKDYYKELPNLSKDIKVGIVPDEESQVSMVMALDSDINNIELSDLSKFNHEEEFNLTKYEGRDYEALLFNYKNDVFKDINFRKAISYAINKTKILEEGYIGNAKLINFPLNSKSKYYNEDVKQLEYNKDKAREHLSKINLKNINYSKNIKNKNNNKEEKDENKLLKEFISSLDLKIVVNKTNNERVKTAHLIKEDLKSIGVKSTIVELEGEELNKAIDNNEYDIAIVGWELSNVPDATSIIQASGYSDEKLQGYITSLINSTSQLQTKDIYKSLQKYVNNNVLFISLVIKDDYIVSNNRLEGKIHPNDFDVYEGITNLNIKK